MFHGPYVRVRLPYARAVGWDGILDWLPSWFTPYHHSRLRRWDAVVILTEKERSHRKSGFKAYDEAPAEHSGTSDPLGEAKWIPQLWARSTSAARGPWADAAGCGGARGGIGPLSARVGARQADRRDRESVRRACGAWVRSRTSGGQG